MVDARGYLCPMPVLMVQKALEAEHPDTLEVLVDNETAVENIKRICRAQRLSGHSRRGRRRLPPDAQKVKKRRRDVPTGTSLFSSVFIRVPSRRSRPGRA